MWGAEEGGVGGMSGVWVRREGCVWGRIEVWLGVRRGCVCGCVEGVAVGALGECLGCRFGADECAWEFLGPRWD